MRKQTVLKVINTWSKTKTWRWLKRHEVIKKELTIQSPDSGKIREENNERGDKYKCNCRGENNMTIIIRKL